MAEDPFRFLDLPPEMRNEIYNLLLPETRETEVCRWRKSMSLSVSNRETIQTLARLLQVSSQIHKEVAPVLYGTLTFRFCIKEQTILWLRSMGSMNKHIRHIHILGWAKSSIRSGLHQLKQAKFLRSVTLGSDIRQYGNYPSEAGVAEVLRPFIHAIRKQQAHENSEDDIIDSIRMEPYWGRFWCRPGSDIAEEARLDRAYASGVQSELTRLLA